ncbi:hypothetical protein GCM10011385_25350 [Nitratireductor aestuarii]|uniref:Glycosyl transferase family 25 domain-containing protein n=1 Tax=Nitratireductor aestuarii TaxID=1735103 RepID=A0A916W5X1_9HYPH|nr:glycosyltransferase family 25 protein [Nitratireductor aestuarii]GGA70438.1 hypothetical protein GCM10011385_25350 [Nitratireductor aestuarii]
MKIEAFIIHLKRAEARRPQVDELIRQLAPLPAHILDAVDGKAMSPQALNASYRPNLLQPTYPFELRPTEVACFLSHRKAWAEIVDRKLDAGLVIEDDVSLVPEVFEEALKLAKTLCDGSPQYIQFGLREPQGRMTGVAADGNVRILRPEIVMLGAQAQLISYEAAKRLLAHSEMFDRPIDVLVQMFWLTGVDPCGVAPVSIVARHNQLGGTTIHARKSLSEKIWREWSRFRHRSIMKKLSRQHRGEASTSR